jgi:hypothetical protein
MQRTPTLLVTLAAAGLLTGAATAAVAITTNGAPAAGDQAAARGQLVATTPSPAQSAPKGEAPNRKGPDWHRVRGPGGFGGLRGLGAGPVLHGEFVTRGQNGSTTTVVIQTGTVTAKNGSRITVQSADTYTATWTLDSNTMVRTGWANGSVKDIAVGDTVRIEGTRSGSTTTARFVGERPKNAPQGGQGGDRGSTTPTPSATATS